MTWSKGSLQDCFQTARTLFPNPGTNPENPGTKPNSSSVPKTYQGFVKALQRVGLKSVHNAKQQLQHQLKNTSETQHRIHGFIALAMDGSRFELPRTKANLDTFGTAGTPLSSPQLWVTSMWHLGMGIPYDWRVDHGTFSERHHAAQMLADVPQQSLIIGDAGFASYALLRQIIDSGREVLVRAGRGVHLIQELACLEQVSDATYYLWPKKAQKKDQPPVILRMVKVRANGDRRKWVYLLTSVLEDERLSDEQVADLYRRRWGIEIGYRSLKQTLGRRKLKSHAPQNVLFEIHGLILGLMLIGLMGVSAITLRDYPAERWSLASTLQIVRLTLYQSKRRYRWGELLGDAVNDTYVRKRKKRKAWPRESKPDPPPRKPRIRKAKRDEIDRYLQVMIN